MGYEHNLIVKSTKFFGFLGGGVFFSTKKKYTESLPNRFLNPRFLSSIFRGENSRDIPCGSLRLASSLARQLKTESGQNISEVREVMRIFGIQHVKNDGKKHGSEGRFSNPPEKKTWFFVFAFPFPQQKHQTPFMGWTRFYLSRRKKTIRGRPRLNGQSIAG